MDFVRNQGTANDDDETEYVWWGCKILSLDIGECAYFIDDSREKYGKLCKSDITFEIRRRSHNVILPRENAFIIFESGQKMINIKTFMLKRSQLLLSSKQQQHSSPAQEIDIFQELHANKTKQ